MPVILSLGRTKGFLLTRLYCLTTYMECPSLEKSLGISPQISPARIPVFSAKQDKQHTANESADPFGCSSHSYILENQCLVLLPETHFCWLSALQFGKAS
jgi:hypothetical protein